LNYRQFQHLAAAMAHEVRNPLNSMAIHVELLEGRLKKEPGAPSPERTQILKSIGTLAGEIERIDRILDEYLTFAGPEETPRRPVDPGTMVAAAVERARALAESRAVRVQLSVPQNLERWNIDADGVAEALDALLVNAMEASPRGSTVTVTLRADSDQGEVTIADEGVGILPEDLPRIFHLGFSRRDRTGIGLTVAKQIVKGHGGSITAESKGPGSGATFRLRLPIEPEAM
jgi:two-component system, sporulation sensor kinase E